VLIVGLPRTGTTLTHDLLALAPDARARPTGSTRRRGPPRSSQPSPAIRGSPASTRRGRPRAASPELVHMLPMDATMPSECNDAMMFHFAGPNFTA
jgi:hypothetical protein